MYRSFDVPSMSSGFRARPVSTHRHAPLESPRARRGVLTRPQGSQARPSDLRRFQDAPRAAPMSSRAFADSPARAHAPQSALRGWEGEREGVGPAPPRIAPESSTTKLRFELRPPEPKSGGPRKIQKRQRNRRLYVLDLVSFLPSAPTRDLGPQAPLIWALA